MRSTAGVAVRSTPVGTVKQQVNIRYGENGLYVDTPNVSAVGPVARLAQRGINAAGLAEPLALPLPTNAVSSSQAFTLPTPQGPLELRPNPAVYVGRPADLAPRRQLANTWHLIRGK